MANALYDSYKKSLLDAGNDYLSDGITIFAVSSGYTFSASHSVKADLGVNIVKESQALGGKTSTAGLADANTTTLFNVTGHQVTGFVVYNSTRDQLMAYYDTAVGLPLTPNGTDIQITIPSGLFQI